MKDTNEMSRDELEHVVEVSRHRHAVFELARTLAVALLEQVGIHDLSKFEEPEMSKFAELTPLLKGSTYGSDQYKKLLEDLGPALKHHYRVNSHHPENHPDGVDGMDLVDLIEMLCDWIAATKRHDDGSIAESLRINQPRFGISSQLQSLLENTVKNYALFE